MKRFNLIILAFATLVFSSCINRDNLRLAEQEVDILIFGLSYGECFKDCFTVYKLEGESLSQDTTVKYMGDYLTYEFNAALQLGTNEYSLVSDLINQVPDEFLTNENKTYGCPDCYDQGGVFIQVKKGNVTRRFVLDTDDSNDQNSEIVTFKQAVMNGIHALRD